MTGEAGSNGSGVDPDKLLVEIIELVRHRAEVHQVTRSLGGGLSDLTGFIYQQHLNRGLVELRHLQAIREPHGERLFLALVRLASDVDPYLGREERGVNQFPVFNPADPLTSFSDIRSLLSQQLTVVLERSATHLVLEDRKYGILLASLGSEITASRSHQIVLQARSDLPPAILQARLPNQIKIAPPEALRQIVNVQLPGLRLISLGQVPRQLPVVPNAVYFQIDLDTEAFAQQVRASGQLAMHVGGEFPGLELTLWAVKVRD